VSVTTITRNCVHRYSPNWVCAGSGHLQLIKFGPSCAPGRGSAAGGEILALSYIIQPARSVCVSLSVFFIICCIVSCYHADGETKILKITEYTTCSLKHFETIKIKSKTAVNDGTKLAQLYARCVCLVSIFSDFLTRCVAS